MENHPHAEGKTCPPSVGVPKYGAGASQSVSRNVQSSPRFSVTIPQLLAALASYGVGYLYLRRELCRRVLVLRRGPAPHEL